MHPSTIINIERSPLRNRLYIVYTAGGDIIHIGNPFERFYTQALGTKKERAKYYQEMGDYGLEYCRSLKAGRYLYETFILNGVSKNKIKNINFFNQHILNQLHLGVS